MISWLFRITRRIINTDLFAIFIFFTVTINSNAVIGQNGRSKSFYSDGTVRADISYVNNIYDGISFWFYPNGNLQYEKSYSLGKLNGWIREFYETGLLKKEYYITDGVIDGVYKSYYENGQLDEVIEFSKGKRVSYKKFQLDNSFKAPAENYLAGNRQLELLQRKNQILICDVEVCPIPIEGINSIQKKLVYPEHALLYGLGGEVTLIATIDTNGNVVNTEIIKHLGLGCDEAAERAVKQTKFIPGQNKGKIVESHVTLTIDFKINEQQKLAANNFRALTNKPSVQSDNRINFENNQVGNKLEKKYYQCSIDECAEPVGGLEAIIEKINIPAVAKRLKLKGDITVEATVDRFGLVRDTKIINGIGYGCDSAVESAIFAVKFIPGKQNSKEVESKVILIIPFDYSR